MNIYSNRRDTTLIAGSPKNAHCIINKNGLDITKREIKIKIKEDNYKIHPHNYL